MRFMFAIRMVAAIHFNDQLSFQADEIDDKDTDGMLATKLKSLEPF